MPSEYSKISRMRIQNFRGVSDASLSFAESPIVALIGPNDSGKTSIALALKVLCYHGLAHDQNKFIKEGTSAFGIQVRLENGTVLSRVKRVSGENSYRINYPNGQEWYVGKIDEGLPQEVVNEMGMIVEPETRQLLHIRDYNDSLLFVNTTNGANYHIMYAALKVEGVNKACKIGSERINYNRDTLGKCAVKQEAYMDQLRRMRRIDTAPVEQVRDWIASSKRAILALQEVESAVCELAAAEKENREYQALVAIYTMRAGIAACEEVIEACEDITKLERSLAIYKRIDAQRSLDTNAIDSLGAAADAVATAEKERRLLAAYAPIKPLCVISTIGQDALQDAATALGDVIKTLYTYKVYKPIKKLVPLNMAGVTALEDVRSAIRATQDAQCEANKLKPLATLREIDLAAINALEDICVATDAERKAQQEVDKLKPVLVLQKLDTVMIDTLAAVQSAESAYQDAARLRGVYSQLSAAQPLNADGIDVLLEVLSTADECSVQEQEIQTLKAQIAETQEVLQSMGVEYVVCPNCGEVIVEEGVSHCHA